MIRKICILLLIGEIGALSAFSAEEQFSVDAFVTGAEPGVGQILVSLFDSPENYLEVPLLEANADVDGEGKALVALGEWVPGEYAIVVVYDKNGNGKLDTGLFRIPQEKIGYSNNAKGKLGPAKWNDAVFLVSDSDLNIDVQLANARDDQ